MWFIKYRLEILEKNIQFSFPLFKKKERHLLLTNFYIEFSNTIVEIIKSIKLSEQDIINRIEIKNESVLQKNIKNKKPFIFICGHYANLEWLALRLSLIPNINLSAVYKPLSNKNLNELLVKIRSKFGAKLITLNKWKYFILKNKKKPYSFMFVADQVPENKNNGIRINFLNQSTLFHTGPEKTAKLLKSEIFYIEMLKIKRGYYTVEFKKISSKNITKEYAGLLEKTITKNPASWLWSHNRWKR